MKNILTNSLTKFSLISSLCIMLLAYFTFTQTISPLHPKRINKIQTIKQVSNPMSFIPLEKLQYQPMFTLEDTSPTFQLISNIKNRSKKSKVLHKVLTSNQKREKFEYVVKKANELNLPPELALIPVIESEYNNKAISYKGAGGLWQLMPGTARIFGVSSKQRFEMKPSTQAALLYFKKLHRKFGNWEFAIAAYNAGDGKISSALRRNSHAKSIHDLKLPRETQNYVLSFYQLKKELQFSNAKTTT